MTDGDSAAVARPKLPVWRTLKESFIFVFANFGRFLALGWLPLAVEFAVLLVFDVLEGYLGGSLVVILVLHVIFYVMVFLVYAVFAVRWHRFILLDDQGGAFDRLLEFRNLIFYGYMMLLVFLPSAPFSMLNQYFQYSWSDDGGVTFAKFGATLIIALMIYLVSLCIIRFSLVFPAAAVDRPVNFKTAWRMMGGNTWRLIGINFLIGFVVLLANILWNVGKMVIVFYFGFARLLLPWYYEVAWYLTIPWFIELVISSIISYMVVAVYVTVLSKTYQLIIGTPEDSTATDATAVS